MGQCETMQKLEWEVGERPDYLGIANHTEEYYRLHHWNRYGVLLVLMCGLPCLTKEILRNFTEMEWVWDAHRAVSILLLFMCLCMCDKNSNSATSRVGLIYTHFACVGPMVVHLNQRSPMIDLLIDWHPCLPICRPPHCSAVPRGHNWWPGDSGVSLRLPSSSPSPGTSRDTTQGSPWREGGVWRLHQFFGPQHTHKEAQRLPGQMVTRASLCTYPHQPVHTPLNNLAP